MSGFGHMLTVVIMCKCTKNFRYFFKLCGIFFVVGFWHIWKTVCMYVCMYAWACGSYDVYLNEAEPNFYIVSVPVSLFSELIYLFLGSSVTLDFYCQHAQSAAWNLPPPPLFCKTSSVSSAASYKCFKCILWYFRSKNLRCPAFLLSSSET